MQFSSSTPGSQPLVSGGGGQSGSVEPGPDWSGVDSSTGTGSASAMVLLPLAAIVAGRCHGTVARAAAGPHRRSRRDGPVTRSGHADRVAGYRGLAAAGVSIVGLLNRRFTSHPEASVA